MRVAWLNLRRYGLGGAIDRFPPALRRFATANGAPEKYHATITVAWLLLIAERLDGHEDTRWETFAAAHPDLLVSHPSLLARYYCDETLRSPRAKRVFVMPAIREEAREGLQ